MRRRSGQKRREERGKGVKGRDEGREEREEARMKGGWREAGIEGGKREEGRELNYLIHI